MTFLRGLFPRLTSHPKRSWLSPLRRGLRAFVTAPPVVGALYVLGLAAWAGQRAQEDDADLGDPRRADAIASFIEHRFAGEITRMKIGIVAAAVALGLVIGLVAEASMALRRPRSKRARRSSAGAFVEAALVCAALHSALVAWAMARCPQLYAASWYAKGGVARTAQLIVTDVLGPRGVVLVTLVGFAFYVRRERIVYLARRARGLLRRPIRGLARAFVSRGAGPAVALVVAAMALRSPSRSLGLAHAAPPASPASNEGSASAPGAPAASSSTLPAASGQAVTSGQAGSGQASSSSARRPNILILAADSLRADRLDPRVAPNLVRLAEKGTRFDRTYVSMPRTFPSWVTILTGRHGHHHGIRSMFPTWEDRARDFDALPSRLARAGWRTGVVSDYAGDIFGRIELGFSRVDTPSFDFRQLIRQRALERETPLLPLLHSQLGRTLFPVMRELNSAADPMLLEADVETAIDALSRGESSPFFLTVFFSTAHFPYAAPAPYYAKYTDPDYRGRFKYHKPVGLGSEAAPDAEDVRQVRALYDGAVTAIDAAVARVLAALEERGLADDTIVVVTADHGETLYDDGHSQGHGDHLFGDCGTHVPLVIYDPRVHRNAGASGAPAATAASPSRREMRVARDVDIAATLYELAGVAPPADLDGRSLAPALRGEPLTPRFAYAETELWFTEEIPGLAPELRMPYPGIMALTELDARHNAEIVLRRDMVDATNMARHRMVRDERYKLVYVPTRKGVKYILFDTEKDPAETQDVAAALPGEVARLRAELWRWMLEDPRMDEKDGFLVPSASPRVASERGRPSLGAPSPNSGAAK